MRRFVPLCALLLASCGGGELVLDPPAPPAPLPVAIPSPHVVGAPIPTTPPPPAPPPEPPPPPMLCDPAHPYVCDVNGKLSVCEPSTGGHVQVAVCGLMKCDAPRGRCDACFPGESTADPDRNPHVGCLDAHTRSVCDDTKDGFGKAEPCPSTAKDCVLGVCMGCKKDADCPVNAATPCSVPKCIDGGCGLAPGPAGKKATEKSTFCDAITCDAKGGEVHAYQTDGTPVPDAPAPPCSVVVCDGMGGRRLDPKPAGVVAPLGPTTDCVTTVCDGQGSVTTAITPDGTVDTKAPSGECFTTQCAGGAPVKVPSPEGTPLAATSPCFSRACDADGGIAITSAPPGTPCGDAVVCDGAGSCLPCQDTGSGLACDDSAPCTEGEGADAAGLFVALDGSDGAAGTLDAPLATVGAALAAAANGATTPITIHVALGTYAGAISISSTSRPITIDGGWTHAGGSWTRTCSERALFTASPLDPAGSPVIRVATASPLTLRALRVETKDASSAVPEKDADGESVLGIALLEGGAPVAHRLVGVEIVTHDAGPGGDGGPGQSGTIPSCVVSLACSDGSPGAEGEDATPVDGTEGFDASGHYAPPAAPTGQPGTDGQRGKLGATQSATCWLGDCEVVGSGGFKACVWKSGPVAKPLTEGGGPCGCGGIGGLGGRGGRRGGASVGVLVASTDVSVLAIATQIVAGGGGPGGFGGPGGTPSAGSDGAPGLTASCQVTTHCVDGECSNPAPSCVEGPFGDCTTDAYYTYFQGTQGMSGGKGGKGGRGADAAGGPSIAVALRTGASWIATGSTVTTVGPGGPGAGAAPAGPAIGVLAY